MQDYIGHLRAVKLGLERRLKEEIPTKLEIIEWASEHSAFLLTRYQVGKDGQTAWRRLIGKPAKNKIVEFGEQVLAKPLRSKKTNIRVSLRTKWIEATWVGATRNSNEHLVVLSKGGPVIKVRTVQRRTLADRWDLQAIKDIRATPRRPNPSDESQRKPMPERETAGTKDQEAEKGIPKDTAVEEEKDKQLREFKITTGIINKYGRTHGCVGCDAQRMGMWRKHNPMCRLRLEEEMMKDASLGARITGRNVRLGRDDEDNIEQKRKAELEKDDNAEVIEEGHMDEDVAEDEPNEECANEESKEDKEQQRILDEYLENEQVKHCTGKEESKKRADPSDTEDTSGKRRRIAMAMKHRSRAINFCSKIKSTNSVNDAMMVMQDLAHESRPSLMGIIAYDVSSKPSDDRSLNKWMKSVQSKIDVSHLFQAAMKADMDSNMPSPHEKDEMDLWKTHFNGYDFYDAVNGDKPLPWEEVLKARKLEIDFSGRWECILRCIRKWRRRMAAK